MGVLKSGWHDTNKLAVYTVFGHPAAESPRASISSLILCSIKSVSNKITPPVWVAGLCGP